MAGITFPCGSQYVKNIMWYLYRGKQAAFQQSGLISKLVKPDIRQTVHLIHNFSSELERKVEIKGRHEILETGKTGGNKTNGT